MNKNNRNDEYISDVMDYFNQVFKGNSIDAKIDTYIVGNYVTTLFVKMENEKHIKYVERIVPKVVAVMDNLPMRFVKDDPNSINPYIEIPNVVSEPVLYEELYDDLPSNPEDITAIPLGKFTNKLTSVSDIVDMRSMLIGGSITSGKTNFINNILVTLIKRTSPNDVRLVLVDPTHFEMNVYKDEPHLLCPVINDPMECKEMLYKLISLMHRRYVLFDKGRRINNLDSYNKWALENNEPKLPYIVVILNEYSLFSVMAKVLNIPLLTLLQKGVACGIYFIISTHKINTHIITPEIKANLSTRIAFHTNNTLDSISIIDDDGANKIIGGSEDMLIKSPALSTKVARRIATPYISTEEVYNAVKESKEKYSKYHDELLLDLNSTHLSKEMKDLFLNNELIDKDNYARVEIWAYNWDTITPTKIQNEFGVDYHQAQAFITMLLDREVILKTNEPDVYEVDSGDDDEE